MGTFGYKPPTKDNFVNLALFRHRRGQVQKRTKCAWHLPITVLFHFRALLLGRFRGPGLAGCEKIICVCGGEGEGITLGQYL